MIFKRKFADILSSRLKEPRRFIQVVSGPRQVGKTTLVQQVLESQKSPYMFVSADEPTLRGSQWIAQQWDAARIKANEHKSFILVFDEVQKLPAWSESIKRFWDEDARNKLPLKVILLGSAPLLIESGLTESLAGRFEVLRLPHWSLSEMRSAFNFSCDQYIFYGGYPGAASLVSDHNRWARYIKDSLIETTISRDILLLSRVDKPALLRRLFEIGCRYSGQIVSYNKILGQLQDAGNTTTLAHYLDLLSGAGMLAGLQKYSKQDIRKRSSSPKFQVLNNALMSSQSDLLLKEARANPEFWGHLIESAIGAHLANSEFCGKGEVFYWRDHNREVDFVFNFRKQLAAIEIKSGRAPIVLPGISAFSEAFHPKKKLLVGTGGISIEEFLSKEAEYWLND